MALAQDFDRAIELINKSTKVIVTSHARPDGDACGCVNAMCMALRSLGKIAEPVFLTPVPKWYEFMFESAPYVLGETLTYEELNSNGYDLVLVVDTNSSIQLQGFGQWLKESNLPVLVIDHHITGDGLGNVEVIDIDAGAAGIIVYDFFIHAGWQITPVVAENIFVAIATDTGWFKFRNADGRAYRHAAQLVEAGANPSQIHEEIYQNYTPARMRLLTRMLSNLTLENDNRVAVQHILQSDFAETGAAMSDTEDLIDQCQRIGSVVAAVLLTELPDGRFKASLRSKSNIDVRLIAQKHNGGGHTMASGCIIDLPLDGARQSILADIAEQLSD